MGNKIKWTSLGWALLLILSIWCFWLLAETVLTRKTAYISTENGLVHHNKGSCVAGTLISLGGHTIFGKEGLPIRCKGGYVYQER